MITIYNARNKELLSTEVDDDSYIYSELKGEHYAYVHFSIPEFVEIPIGSYIELRNERFTLFYPHNIKINNTKNYEYTITLYSSANQLKIYKFRELVQAQTGEWGGSRKIAFNLTAKPKEHLKMLVDNLNSRKTGWEVGDCIDGYEKLISYNDTMCWDAVQSISDEFETEFEIVGQRISLKKVGYFMDEPLQISYGKGNGLLSGITKAYDSENTSIGRLFVIGGERNITYSSYGSKTLMLPVVSMFGFDGEHFQDEAGYDSSKASFYSTNADRLSVYPTDKSTTGLERESSYDGSAVYPSHTCTISKVEIDSTNCYQVTLSEADREIAPYLVNNRIPDTYETIVFQTGELSGKEFQVNPLNDGMVIQIIPEEIDGIDMPSAPFVPKVGDTFNVYNILLPESYIREAEMRMLKDAIRFLHFNGEQVINIDCVVDKIWALKNWSSVGHKFRVGAYVSFTDTQAQVKPLLMRIMSVKSSINNEKSISITLSNATKKNRTILTDIKKALGNSLVFEDKLENAKNEYEEKVYETTRVFDYTFDDVFL